MCILKMYTRKFIVNSVYQRGKEAGDHQDIESIVPALKLIRKVYYSNHELIMLLMNQELT